MGSAPVPGVKLGEGGEAEVFALDDDRVLRRFRTTHVDLGPRVALTEEIARAAAGTGLVGPEVLDRCTDAEGRPCTIERRLPGVSMLEALGSIEGDARSRLLDDYLATALRLRRLRCARTDFGELITDPPLRRATWQAWMRAVLDRQTAHLDEAARTAIPDLEGRLAALRDDLATIPEPEPAYVHFDYFPGNVLCEGDTITAVIDWSGLAIVGDPDLDVVLAAAYLGVCQTVRPSDHDHAARWLADRGLAARADVYRRFGAAWWLPVTEDASIRPWVVAELSRDGAGRTPTTPG